MKRTFLVIITHFQYGEYEGDLWYMTWQHPMISHGQDITLDVMLCHLTASCDITLSKFNTWCHIMSLDIILWYHIGKVWHLVVDYVTWCHPVISYDQDITLDVTLCHLTSSYDIILGRYDTWWKTISLDVILWYHMNKM